MSFMLNTFLSLETHGFRYVIPPIMTEQKTVSYLYVFQDPVAMASLVWHKDWKQGGKASLTMLKIVYMLI